MKKIVITSLMLSAALISGCDNFKNKKDTEAKTEAPALEDWSCTAQANIDQLQDHLKNEYLKELNKEIRQSDYEADQQLMDLIVKNLKFNIQNVTTLTEDPNKAKTLECSSQLLVVFPKGLQKRAENAFAERPCDEGCEERGNYTLNDSLEDGESGLSMDNDQLKGNFSYSITKTDKDGLSLSVPSQNDVIDSVVTVTRHAVLYAAYSAQNKRDEESYQQGMESQSQQMSLAQKAMDIRKKELDQDNGKVVDRLNQTWDRFSDEQKAQLQQDQADWFEKRDIDCKVLAQKSVYSLNESEKETYQKHSQYWDEAMNTQNQELQYTKCFNQKTTERIVYLNNVFN